MAPTVRQLLEVARLGLVVCCGEAGLGREVYRAQVSELPDPWVWLEAGSLVMTTGMGLPRGSKEQGRYIEMLDDHGLSALLIGEHSDENINAPDLSEDLVRASYDRSFPVLTMPYKMPFGGVAEIVSRAASDLEHESLLRALKIYDTVRQVIPAPGESLLPHLAGILGCDLYLLDPATGRSAVPDDPVPDTETLLPEGFLQMLRDFCEDGGRLVRSTIRIATERGSAIVVSVPSTRNVALVAFSQGEREPDLSSLRHSAAVVAIEVERETAERERRYRLGTELFSELMEGSLEEVVASRTLADLALSTEDLIIAAVGKTGDDYEDKLLLQLEELGIEPLLRRYADYTVILLSDDLARESLVREINGPVGLSASVKRLSRTSEAVREAMWALWQARELGISFAEYGTGEGAPFLPRTISESQAAVQCFLGSILEYDSENETLLVPTLRAYLANGRSLKAAASAMRVHRQTVVYRMRRFEELTGFRLEKMDDVANLWLALKCLEVLDRLSSDDPSE